VAAYCRCGSIPKPASGGHAAGAGRKWRRAGLGIGWLGGKLGHGTMAVRAPAEVATFQATRTGSHGPVGWDMATLNWCGSPKWDCTGRVRTRERARRVGWMIVRFTAAHGPSTHGSGSAIAGLRAFRRAMTSTHTKHEARKPNASTLKARNAKGEHARGKEARRTHSSATTKHVHAL
jgi:hypothetical protein